MVKSISIYIFFILSILLSTTRFQTLSVYDNSEQSKTCSNYSFHRERLYQYFESLNMKNYNVDDFIKYLCRCNDTDHKSAKQKKYDHPTKFKKMNL